MAYKLLRLIRGDVTASSRHDQPRTETVIRLVSVRKETKNEEAYYSQEIAD